MLKSHKVKFSIYLVVCSVIIAVGACNENPVAPTANQHYGISGKIYDVDGNIISDAKIYCLYFLNTIPNNPTIATGIQKVSNTKDFGFELFQSFPNPCSNSFYVRFSLPAKCSVEFSILTDSNRSTLYKRSDTLQYGLYQLYFNNIVDSLDIKNGVYLYHLNAKSDSGEIYDSEKSFLVVNDSVKPNAISDKEGNYFFDLQDAFIGDTVTVMNGDLFGYYQILNSNVNLLIVKGGYDSRIVNVQLLPDKILNQDIIIGEKK